MRFGASETYCRSCQQVYPVSDLDRYLWCPGCQTAVRKRGATWGLIVGLLASIGMAAYVLLGMTLQSRFFAFYVLMVAITYVLTSRIAHAVVYGYYRSRGGMINPPPQEPE